ncbi:hypothetical protein [Corynebacterium timonense]|uniref:hypothetical protein n=1 Tax=Corynebacterium timonense TaxID=441500 RepID=UPI0012DF6C01|nr:hypothetical protein [Corynebacterium timonense]
MKLKSSKLLAAIVAISVGLSPVAVANAKTATAPEPLIAVREAQQNVTPKALQAQKELQSPEVQTYGARGFLIKQALRLVSSLLRNHRVTEVIDAARKRGFIDDDMANAISARPDQIADAIDNTLSVAGDYEEGIKERLTKNLTPIVGGTLASASLTL